MIVTAAVCTYERYDVLGDAIRSLGQQQLPADAYQVLVVDNSPDAAKASQFAAGFRDAANVRFLHVDRPGLSHARNVALAESQSPYIAFIDDDALAPPDWLANIARFFDSAEPDAAAVGGPAEAIWEAPRPPWLPDQLVSYLGAIDWGDQQMEVGPEQWLIGCNVAYRREAVAKVGGFRTDLGRQGHLLLSNEELELHERLRQEGYRVFYCPEVRVRHRVAKNRMTPEWMRRRVFWQAISDQMSRPNQQPAGPPRKGLFSIPDDDPILFQQECYRIMEAVKEMNAGRSVI